MATFLPAPPERVWPWLVQMGGDRAGWYSWDWLDNNGKPSADRVVHGWQDLEMGRHLKGPTNWWIVVALEPNRTLVMQSSYGLLTGRSFDPRSGLLPRVYVEGIWGFHLRQAAGGRTRLVVRTRSRSRPRLFARPFGLLLEGTSAFHDADSPVPQPRHSGRRRGMTRLRTVVTPCRSAKKPDVAPVVEMLRYLEANGFAAYIASGC